MTITFENELDFVLTMKVNSETKKYALNVLDYLYYHDFVFSVNCTKYREIQYELILSTIDDLNLVRAYDGKKAALYKHFLLCGFEIKSNILNEIDNFGFLKDANEIFKKLLYQVVDCNFLENDFLKDVDFLIDKFKNINKSFTCKLVGWSLYYEYDAMSIWVLIRLLSANVLTIKKYRSVIMEELIIFFNDKGIREEKYRGTEKEIEKQSLNVFFRAMLFAEFEIMKKQILIKNKINAIRIDFCEDVNKVEEEMLFINLLIKSKSLINANYKSISTQNFNFEMDFCDYIRDINNRLAHQKIFFDDVKGCVGFLGGLYVNYALEYSEVKVLHKEPENENICDVMENTAADTARLIMKRYGFSFERSRTICSYYKKINSNNELVFEWFQDSLNSRNSLMCFDFCTYRFLKKRGVRFPLYNLI